MREEIERHKQFSRRALVLGGAKLAVLGGLMARLYQLQVVEAHKYELLAEENRINLRLLPPPRGIIRDRFGEPMALNRPTYRLVLVPEQADSVTATLERVAALVPLTEAQIRRVLDLASSRRGFVPVTVREDLSWTELTRIEVHAPELPGVSIETGLSRHYPYAHAASHIVGYVSAVSRAELTGDALLELPGFRTGKSGVEKVFERSLRGAAGTSRVEVNAFGRVIREMARKEGRPGEDLTLTIDMGLQGFAARRLGEEAGTAVVMDVRDGDILALVSSPGFDPNDFNRGLRADVWKSLLNDPRAPLVNKAVAGQYPPGSTFKPVVALAALEAGVVDSRETVECRGSTELGDHRFHCWRRWGHGRVDMVGAIKRSCDIYFYELARRLGIDRIAAMALRFGFGSPSGVELAGERPGLMPTRAWKEAVFDRPWQGGETLIAGIGQGYVLATPVQLAMMAARLANGDHAVVPRLVRGGDAGSGAAPPAMDLIRDHLALVRNGMDRVVNDADGGTGFGARIEEPGMEMAGKTGTSQVRRISAAERKAGTKQGEIPWNHRDHALFVAYAPAARPRYACAVVIEHGGSGSRAAAPVARDILRETQRRHRQSRPGDGDDARAFLPAAARAGA